MVVPHWPTPTPAMDTDLATAGNTDDRRTTAVVVPARPDGVRQARETVARAARAAGLSKDCVDNLVIAVSEACTNAVEAQLAAGKPDDVQVRCRVTNTPFVIEVEDRAGPGFNAADVPVRPPLGDPRHLDVERGWGIQLMRQRVDRLEYFAGPAGSIARLEVGLPR